MASMLDAIGTEYGIPVPIRYESDDSILEGANVVDIPWIPAVDATVLGIEYALDDGKYGGRGGVGLSWDLGVILKAANGYAPEGEFRDETDERRCEGNGGVGLACNSETAREVAGTVPNGNCIGNGELLLVPEVWAIDDQSRAGAVILDVANSICDAVPESVCASTSSTDVTTGGPENDEDGAAVCPSVKNSCANGGGLEDTCDTPMEFVSARSDPCSGKEMPLLCEDIACIDGGGVGVHC